MINATSVIYICLDNLRVGKAARSSPNGISYSNFKKIWVIAKNWLDEKNIIKVQWIPSHRGLKRKEIVRRKFKSVALYYQNVLGKETHTSSYLPQSVTEGKNSA